MGDSNRAPLANSWQAPKLLSVSVGIKGDRDITRVRRRYLKFSKADLVARLLAVEQAHVILQERWLEANEEVLSWRLRAERAELQLRRAQEA